jgi:hypothetical protein
MLPKLYPFDRIGSGTVLHDGKPCQTANRYTIYFEFELRENVEHCILAYDVSLRKGTPGNQTSVASPFPCGNVFARFRSIHTDLLMQDGWLMLKIENLYRRVSSDMLDVID